MGFMRIVAVGGTAGLLFGFDTAVIAGTTQGLTAAFQLTPAMLGLTVSSALWGTLLGAALAGVPGDALGARTCLRGVAGLYVISGLASALAPSLAILIMARVLAGVAVGASSVLAPTYLAEIAPAQRRGAIVGLFQLNIVAGILVAYLSNYLVGQFGLGDHEWRWKFGVTVLPSLILAGLLFTIPHSPRWLITKGRSEEAGAVLAQLGTGNADGILNEAHALNAARTGGDARLTWQSHARPMTLAVLIAAFNQLSGINAILYYLNDIFEAAGFGKVSADIQSVIIGTTNLVFTGLALLVIDRVGRRTLLLVGSVGLAASLFGVALIQLNDSHQALLLPMLIVFIASFAFSQGAVIWVYIAEIFPNEVRARGQALGSSTHWVMDALIAGMFPVVAQWSKGLPFVFFGTAMVVQFLVVFHLFPETKRIGLEDMSQSLGD